MLHGKCHKKAKIRSVRFVFWKNKLPRHDQEMISIRAEIDVAEIEMLCSCHKKFITIGVKQKKINDAICLKSTLLNHKKIKGRAEITLETTKSL